jgi:hypothetical protein
VIGRCDLDDVPLRAFATLRGARRYAATVTKAQVTEAASQVLGVEAHRVHAVAVTEFRAGRPGRIEIVKVFPLVLDRTTRQPQKRKRQNRSR